ncbi:histidine kinase [Streptomyces alboniger]|uniref:histidine kinase n=1 Tax=Streptomyces alboniger TaxID=132473 RepID=UPI00087791FD|nr:histidine kinase [Streptomyces alboniger]
MVGGIRALQRGWQGRSKIEKVEFQSMAMWHAMPWLFFLSWGSLPLGLSLDSEPVPQVLGWTLIAVGALQGVHVNRSLRRSVDHYLKRAAAPRRDLAVSGCLLALALGLVLGLEAVDGVADGMIGFTTLYLAVPFCQALAFAVSVRGFLVRVALIDVAAVAAFAAIGVRDERLAGFAALIAFAGLLTLLSARCGAWTLSVMWEADRAREVEARLAVAEERLRFGRDLHDVMGRNLAVIALKSELAVQLARRGRPEAVDQMVEVQRIAQESQREVREVVRGYREADLGVELLGAQGVLEAAGIGCRVTGSTAGLPVPVQSALGWVVREAATNVLRHGDATRCDISLTVAEGRTTLTVENDGAPDVPPPGTGREPSAPGGGSGLAGLRERLAEVGGSLDFTCTQGRFRLTAEVPVSGADDERQPRGAAGGRLRAPEGSARGAAGSRLPEPAGSRLPEPAESRLPEAAESPTPETAEGSAQGAGEGCPRGAGEGCPRGAAEGCPRGAAEGSARGAAGSRTQEAAKGSAQAAAEDRPRGATKAPAQEAAGSRTQEAAEDHPRELAEGTAESRTQQPPERSGRPRGAAESPLPEASESPAQKAAEGSAQGATNGCSQEEAAESAIPEASEGLTQEVVGQGPPPLLPQPQPPLRKEALL